MLQTLLRLFRKRPGRDLDSDLVSVVDIGTEVVKVLITKRSGREMAVLGSGQCRQTLKDMATGTVLDIEGVAENCLEAIKEAEYAAGVAPGRIIIGLAGELVRSTVSTIEYVRSSPDAEITPEELQNIVERVQWEAFEEIRTAIAGEGMEEMTDIKLIHSAITGVRIDEMDITNPVSFTGTRLEVSVFNVFAPLMQYRSVETVARLLDRRILMVACEPYAVSRCLGFNDGSDVSALFVDIGGGTTDVALVTRGSVRSTTMFGIGGRAFTKAIARTLDIPYREAEDVKTGKRPLPGAAAKALKDTVGSWLEGMTLSLSPMVERDSLPSKIFLCGGGSLLPEIKEALEAGDWSRELGLTHKPRVTHLYPRDVANVVDYTKKLKSPQDVTPMALANLALQLSIHETALSKMLRKASRLVEK